MRPLPLLAAVLCALSAGAAAEARSGGPSPALIKTACSSGLLVQRTDADKPDAAADDGGEEAESAFSGLFGGGGDEGGEKKKGDKPAKPAKKPKTKLIRPRSEKDKAACPAQMKDYYSKYGDQVTAVPAPPDVPTEQIEANIDRVFGLAAGPAKKETLSTLKDGDLAKKSAVVAKLFDGVKTLDAGSFETVEKHVQALAAARGGKVLDGDFENSTADGDPAAKPDQAPPPAPAPAPALDPKADDSPMSAEQRQRFSRVSAPPDIRQAPSWRPPSVGSYEPGPPAQSAYNRWVPNFVQDAATTAGSWAADKVWGGGNPAVNVEMPADGQSPPRWRRVRFGNYGTEAMIKGLVAVGTDMGKLNAPTLQIGDISQKGGGTFRRHLSHKVGKDVDVFFITGKNGRFDVPWNITLAATAVKDMNVTHIFVDTPLKNYMTQYVAAHPEIPAEERGYMTKALSKMSYWPGHDTHFHIRIDY
jgi:hypothetical protein